MSKLAISRIGSMGAHLDKLPIFMAVAKAGTLCQAAAELKRSQPALSRTIKQLEDAIGTQLFLRTSRGIELTEAGIRLHEFTETLLQNVARLENELKFLDAGVEGRIEVGTKEPYAVYLWPRYLSSLYQLFPALDIGLHVERSNAALIKLLLAHQLHMILIPEPKPLEHLTAFEIRRDSYAFYASPRLEHMPLMTTNRVGGEEIDLLELSGIPLFLFSSAISGGNVTLGQRLSRLRGAFNPTREVGSFAAAQAMALQGLGVAVLPKTMADPHLSSGALTQLFIHGLPPDLFDELKICLCVHADNARSQKLRAIIRHLRAMETYVFKEIKKVKIGTGDRPI